MKNVLREGVVHAQLPWPPGDTDNHVALSCQPDVWSCFYRVPSQAQLVDSPIDCLACLACVASLGDL